MSLDGELSGTRRILSLVQICQRVASAYVENIYSLGEDVRLDLVKPILQHSSPQTLLRLEQATPTLANETSDLWKALCFQTFPLAAEQHYVDEDPESWRDAYFVLRGLEQQRLEAVGNKLRTQREQMEQRRKESQVKFTEKLPPAKRSRGWVQTQPKTLFQKTRSDAVKMRKGIYGARIPIPPVKSLRPPNPPSAKMTLNSNSSSTSFSRASGTRVIVNTISSTPAKTTASAQTMLRSTRKPIPSVTTALKPVSALPMARQTTLKPSPPIAPTLPSMDIKRKVPPKAPLAVEVQPVTLKPPPMKRDPTATMFMPKHRSYSQLPTQTNGMRSRV